MKVTLIGRPGRIVERAAFTLLMLTHRGPLPSLPKGIPAPTKTPATDYVIYIGAKQWAKVKDAIKRPDDALIIEGVQVYDPDYAAIAVFATSVTTKLIQQQQRAAQQAPRE